MEITRRTFCEGTAALAVSALLFGSSSLMALVRPAFAQENAPEKTVPMVELLKPPPYGDRQLGPNDAPVTIIEYGSLTCPHCAHFENTAFPELKRKYIDSGKVRYIFREFALNPLDAGAIMLARCVDKDKYFPFIETLYRTQDKWVVQKPLGPLFDISKQVGFTKEKFDACLKNQKLLDEIESERNRASEKFGVDSTPTFFINGKMERGAMSFADMEKLIQPYLTGK